jgi:hypothetical protein
MMAFSLFDADHSIHWPTTNGTVLESNIEVGTWSSKRVGSKPYYQPKISYSYKVNGAEYRSKKVSFTERSGSVDQSWAKSITSSYPIGKKVTVYYKPGDPTYAVLEPGVNTDNYVVLATALACLFGGGTATLIGWRALKRAQKAGGKGDKSAL